MTNKRIPDLGSITVPLAGTEVIPIWNGTTTTKVTVANLTASGAYPGNFNNLNIGLLSLLGGTTNSGSGIRTQSPSYEVRNSGADTFEAGVYFGGAASAANIQAGGIAATLDVWVYNGGWQRSARFNAGKLTIPDNFVPSTSGKGIDFSAHSSAAGMTSKVLVDYEEGTWTPIVGGTSIVYGWQNGRYVKVGRLVTFTAHLSISSGTPTNVISGLPFPNSTAVNYDTTGGVNVIQESNCMTFGAGRTFLSSYVVANASTINLEASGSNLSSTAVTLSSTFSIYISGSYIAAS